MAIKVYSPRVSVVLIKNVANAKGVSARHSGSRNQIDLTGFLGDSSEVVTNNSTDPTPGQFTITFVDRADPVSVDTLYSLISPMDNIEIRMAHDPHNFRGNLQIVMRGFVSRVRRAETMGDDGRPIRSVSVLGYDYTKVLIDYQFFLWREYATGTDFIEKYIFMRKLGPEQPSINVNDFMALSILQLANPYLERIFGNRKRGEEEVAQQIGVEMIEIEGNVVLHGISIGYRSLWDIMVANADTPWNELFVVDNDDSPRVVFRPKPYRDYESGAYILPNASAAEVSIGHEDAKSIDVTRSDIDTANLYWVSSPPMSFFLKNQSFRAAEARSAIDTVYLRSHPNSSPDLFGDRVMEVQSMLSPWGTSVSNLPKPEKDKAEVDLENFLRRKRLQLMDLNKDNVAFENGTIVLRGNEQIQPGVYLKIRRGSLESEYYVKSVTHRFAPFKTYETHVHVIRGTGWRDRSRLAGSPYFSEIGKGAHGPVSNK